MQRIDCANQIWASFKEKPGSQHIASRVAVAALMKWLKREKPKSVLEIGAGIGTLTYTTIRTLNSVFQRADFTLISTENNEFCLQELDKNLADYKDQFMVVQSVSELPETPSTFDFIITDGGMYDDDSLFSRLGNRSFIFVEGNREEQSLTLEKVLGERSFVKADVRNLRARTLDKTKWEKGYRIYKINPNLTEKLLFKFLNLKTSFVYRVRPFIENIRILREI